jgi:exodeoxyribonuclease VII small subunit
MAVKKTEGQCETVAGGQNFESSLERLEKIVREMEDKKLSLEEMISRFEEGQGLLKFCSNKLNEVEKKIEVLVKKGDRVVTEQMDEDDGSKRLERGDTDGGSMPF